MDSSDSSRAARWAKILEGAAQAEGFWRSRTPSGAEASGQQLQDSQRRLAQERMAETRAVQAFCQEREALLAALSSAGSIESLSSLHARYMRMMSSAEQQLAGLVHLRGTLVVAMDRASEFYSQGHQLALERIRLRQQQQAAHQAALDANRRRMEESRAREQETNDYIRGLREETRRRTEASRQRNHELFCSVMFGRSECYRCGRPKILSHTYCSHCYH